MPPKIDSFAVARRAGVSRTTVSHVLNDRRDISIAESTRARVLAVAAELGYRPNAVARSLVRGRTRTLGVVVPALSLNLVGRMVNGIQDACDRHDFRLLVAQGRGEPDLERAQGSLLLEHRVEGLICLPGRRSAEETRKWLSELADEGTPSVLVDERIADPRIDFVLGDDAGGAAAMVRHLLSLGHRRIAHFCGNQDVRIGRERLEGYRRALAEGGISEDEALIVHYSLEEAGIEAALEQVLSLPDPPTALFAANDYLAAGLYRLAVRRGLRTPEDLAVTGFGDIGAAAALRLTTVSHPAREMGEQAALRLFARIEEPGRPAEGLVLPTQVIIRETCGAAQASSRSGLSGRAA